MSTTPTLRDAAQALADAVSGISSPNLDDRVEEALEALRAALTQGAGEAVEPLAFRLENSGGPANAAKQLTSVPFPQWMLDEMDVAFPERAPHRNAPLYPAPPAQQLQQAVARAVEEAEKRMLAHISKVIWVERDRHVTLLGKCIAQGDKARADTYEQIARALDELHEGIQP